MTNPFFSLKTIMQKTAILRALLCFLKICHFLNWWCKVREKGSCGSYVKVGWREWPLILLCLAVLNILGSHEVTSSIFQMQQQKDFSPCPPAPTSGSHTPVGNYFSGEMALIKALIFLLISPKTINKEMHQQQWGGGGGDGTGTCTCRSRCCIHLPFICLTMGAARSAGLLSERNYLLIIGLCDLSLLVFQSVYRTLF